MSGSGGDGSPQDPLPILNALSTQQSQTRISIQARIAILEQSLLAKRNELSSIVQKTQEKQDAQQHIETEEKHSGPEDKEATLSKEIQRLTDLLRRNRLSLAKLDEAKDTLIVLASETTKPRILDITDPTTVFKK